MNAIPALVLVHGAFHHPLGWKSVIDEFPRELDIRTVALPSSGTRPEVLGDMYSDADAVRSTVEGIGGPVVVCAHSYGGIPVTEALAGVDNVRRLVYLCAFQLDVGESLLSATGGTPPDWWQMHESDGYIDALRPEEIFYTDLDPSTAREASTQLSHQSLRSMTQALTRAAWHNIPSTYIVCERDAAIPVAAQLSMAHRAQRVRRMDTAHSPLLSRPAELAALLLAESTTVQA
ncbi:MAG: alpha/beta hydrolase [Pseudonocardiaceae bacterium]